MAIPSNILAWESHGQRSLVGYSLWGHEESDMTDHTHTSRKEEEPGTSNASLSILYPLKS